MRIEFSLEPPDLSDPNDIDPLGNISLIGDETVLTEKCVFIDTFLCAIQEGYQRLCASDYAEIDLIDEPQPLIFRRTADGFIIISYKDNLTKVRDFQSIKPAIDLALSQLAKAQEAEQAEREKYSGSISDRQVD